jgi:hypothetical protein
VNLHGQPNAGPVRFVVERNLNEAIVPTQEALTSASISLFDIISAEHSSDFGDFCTRSNTERPAGNQHVC